jgi:hypothetical protein
MINRKLNGWVALCIIAGVLLIAYIVIWANIRLLNGALWGTGSTKTYKLDSIVCVDGDNDGIEELCVPKYK